MLAGAPRELPTERARGAINTGPARKKATMDPVHPSSPSGDQDPGSQPTPPRAPRNNVDLAEELEAVAHQEPDWHVFAVIGFHSHSVPVAYDPRKTVQELAGEIGLQIQAGGIPVGLVSYQVADGKFQARANVYPEHTAEAREFCQRVLTKLIQQTAQQIGLKGGAK